MPKRGNLQVIAHRGASAVAPENTLAAFREAIRLRVDWIELDVRLSRDGEPMVFHDRDLERTTNGRGPLGGFSLSRLKELDAGSWFSPAFSGEKIPTLAEAVELIYEGRTGLIIELKLDAHEEASRGELVRRVQERVSSAPGKKRVVLASFDRECVLRCQQLRPARETGLIFSDPTVWKDSRSEEMRPLKYLISRWSIVAPDLVSEAHRAGRSVFAWTIDRREELEKILPCGVDAVASNNPAWLMAILKEIRY